MRRWTLVLGVFAASCSTDTFETDGGADAASDAGSDRAGDASGGPFCATVTPAPFFCMDFDEGDPAAAFSNGVAIKVQTPQPALNTSFALGADGIGASGDGIFKTSLIATGTHDDWYAQPISFDAVVTGASLKFAWRLDAYKPSTASTNASSGEIAHVNIHDNSGATPLLATFFLTGEGHAGMTFQGLDSPPFQSLTVPTMGPWHQVELKVTLLAQSLAHFEVVIDGVTTAALQNHGTFATPQSDFALGASVTGPFEATGWAIDNAVFGPL